MDLSKIKEEIPFTSPVQPVQLNEDSKMQFDCHPGVSCFNACCKNIDIQLMPYDILRLKRRLDMNSQEFVARHTVPFEMDFHGMPGLKLATKPGSQECRFLGENGCTVYEDRPSACRYYAIGSMDVRKVGSADVERGYFLVKEPHCKGHEELKEQTVAEYRQQQGVEDYDAMNDEWRRLVLKKRSSGPTVGSPSARSMQLFDMCSYDMDSLRNFMQTDGFKDVFALGEDEYQTLLDDEDKRLQFAYRFLRQVLFGEQSIPLRDGAREDRLAKRRDQIQQRHAEEAEAHRRDFDQYESASE